jgi:hypothetical protein
MDYQAIVNKTEQDLADLEAKSYKNITVSTREAMSKLKGVMKRIMEDTTEANSYDFSLFSYIHEEAEFERVKELVDNCLVNCELLGEKLKEIHKIRASEITFCRLVREINDLNHQLEILRDPEEKFTELEEDLASTKEALKKLQGGKNDE